MRRTIFKIITLGIIAVSTVVGTIASGAPVAPANGLHVPDAMVGIVDETSRAAYDRTLAIYRQAVLAHPADVALAIAACRFSEHFASSEDLPWADAAWKDFNACQATLEKRHGNDPEASLFLLEHRFGQPARDFAEPLIAPSARWSRAQQARLHAKLAGIDRFLKDDERAGREALLATQLDPASNELIPAMRYLVKQGKTAAAADLLAAAPVPKSPWIEAARIRAATELLPGRQAGDELQRARRAGLQIDTYTAARALEHVGDAAGAHALLVADKSPRQNESAENRQFRLDLAFDARDAATAGDIIRDQFASTHDNAHLASAYVHLVSLDPTVIARRDLLSATAGLATFLLLSLLGLVALPGVLLFPAHYRGTVRQRLGKPCAPVFARIGLRHAWLALAIFTPAIYLIAMVHFGGSRSLSTTGGGVTRIDWQQRIVMSYLWTALFAGVALISVGRLLSWREWLGSGRWKPAWLLLPAALLACDAYLVHVWMTHPHTPSQIAASNATWAAALVHGAQLLGGLPLALLVVSVLAPIMEELVFRGCLLGGLSRHLSFGWANTLQAIVFAAVHQDAAHFVYLCVLGALAGWLAKKTRGLAVPILLHALNNAIFVYSVAN